MESVIPGQYHHNYCIVNYGPRAGEPPGHNADLQAEMENGEGMSQTTMHHHAAAASGAATVRSSGPECALGKSGYGWKRPGPNACHFVIH